MAVLSLLRKLYLKQTVFFNLIEMEIYLYQIGGYLIRVFHESLNQLFTLFGPFLILIVFLNLSASVMARLSVRLLGRNLFLYGFAWLGCSVHELSHAFFALVFGHKIKISCN